MVNSKPNIIERALVGKHSDVDCEDGIVISKHFVAVIDGSTSKTSDHYHPTMRNGRYAMTLISKYLINQASPMLTMEEFCEGVTEYIHQVYRQDDAIPRLSPQKRLCASVVVYNVTRREIWMIGDCQCCIDGSVYTNNKPCEAAIAEKRSRIFPCLQAVHSDMVVNGQLIHDYARDAVMDELVESMKGENIDYAVIDGFHVYTPGVKVIRLSSEQCYDIVLASDGYPFLKPTLAESEKALQQQMASDPFNISTFKATKGCMAGNVSFDDRAFIRFTT